MHDDDNMNMPQSSSTSSKKQPESQEKMSEMGKQGGMTKDSKAKMMPESSSEVSNMPKGLFSMSSGDMSKQQHMESDNKQSGGMGQEMGKDMKKGMEGMKEGLKK